MVLSGYHNRKVVGHGIFYLQGVACIIVSLGELALYLFAIGCILGIIGILLGNWKETWFIFGKMEYKSWSRIPLSPGSVLRILGFFLAGAGLLIIFIGVLGEL